MSLNSRSILNIFVEYMKLGILCTLEFLFISVETEVVLIFFNGVTVNQIEDANVYTRKQGEMRPRV